MPFFIRTQRWRYAELAFGQTVLALPLLPVLYFIREKIIQV